MRFTRPSVSLLLGAFLAITPFAAAQSAVSVATGRFIGTASSTACSANSKFSASEFQVIFSPDTNRLDFNITGTSTVTGNVTIEFRAYAYGIQAFKQTFNPCESEDLRGMCPMNAGPIPINSYLPVPEEAAKQIPSVAYTVPDIDFYIQIYINGTDTGENLACIEAKMTNGKTVYLPVVSWVIAIITGLGLIAAAVASGLGHSNTSAHVAANTLSLFGFFQSQAFLGMSSVHLPPIVASWTQDFQWSMGIIRVGFIQTLASWYQHANGCIPTTTLCDFGVTVELQKRSLEMVEKLARRGLQFVDNLAKRTNSQGVSGAALNNKLILRGIQRVGYRARIELTNIFLTGYIFYIVFILFVVLCIVIFKLICEALVKSGRMKGDKFIDFRNGWTTVLKGILFRVALIGFPQMVVLCFWEFTVRDSPAVVTLAVFAIITITAILAWASSKVIRLARRSINMHKNPAYILYSDPVTLNKWGFLYVSYKATAYYWVVVSLGYILIKGLFIAFAQSNGTVQAIALLVVDASYFVALCVVTPFMDKKTNAFNISIQAINFLNAIFLLIFTNIFGAPGAVRSIIGVALFVINAVFALVLLILLLVASGYALFSRNPDVRYAPMRDDRGSFIKSQNNLSNELDALGATARGEGRGGAKGARIEDDEDGYSSSDVSRIGGNSSSMAGRYEQGQIPASPQTAYSNGMYNEKGGFYGAGHPRSGANSPAPSAQMRGPKASPWQRGAGYD